MDYRIKGRVALVVGGSKGIGKETAKMLAAEGSRVAIVARTRTHIDRAVEEITRVEDYVDSYRTYTLSQVHMLRAVLPAMREAGWGRLVHIGSDGESGSSSGPGR